MLEKLLKSVEIIQALGDNPNIDDGLSSEELKMKFDEAARIIKAYLNESLVPYVNQLSESISKQLDDTLTRPDLAAQSQAVGNALKKYAPVFISDTQPTDVPALWFNTSVAPQSAEPYLELDNDESGYAVQTTIDGQTYGVENATVNESATESTYDFTVY